MPNEEKHPHLIARENLERMIADKRLSEEERNKAKMHLFVINGIIDLVSSVTKTYPDLCYMNACDLIDEFLFDPEESFDQFLIHVPEK
jgi:hypothetical protein